ncbi:MAG: hypothetical protein BWY31_01746 [Lentisphaerae bacterium ADurb.Bin242]|nr:MAG: hypothetical protein BWY31_01746 [Lentisphaerae bacterium ADurb.Bin242]
MKWKWNFTLIELLIVVSIIAILAGMLLPALNSAREQAKSIRCLSQEKQIGLAFNMYVSDYKGYFPSWRTYADGADCPVYIEGGYWHVGLARLGYARNKIFVCNLKNKEKYSQLNADGTPSAFNGYGYNYGGIGGAALINGGYASYSRPAHINELKKISGVYLVMDTIRSVSGEDCGSLILYWGNDKSVGIPDAARHSGKVNILYGDGRASSMKINNPANPYLTIKGWGTEVSKHFDCWTGGRLADDHN